MSTATRWQKVKFHSKSLKKSSSLFQLIFLHSSPATLSPGLRAVLSSPTAVHPNSSRNRLGEADSTAVFNNGGKNEKILKEAIPPQRLSGERNSAAMQFMVAELAACGAPAFRSGGRWERTVRGRQRESGNLTNKSLSPLNPPHLKGERHGLKTLPPHTRSESVWSVLDNFINPGKCNQMEPDSEPPVPSGRQRETFILARRARNLPFVIKSTQINCVCYP